MTHQNRVGRLNHSMYETSPPEPEHFHGLESGTSRYDLLLLVKRAGRSYGFSPRMINLLDYYMAFTRECDWEEGSSPIIYQSLAKTALDMGVSERQIQRLEKELFKVGALQWHDSGNHKRYGKRCPETGRILYAYGVDLSPLAHLKERLQKTLEEKQLYDRAWMETKRQISYYRAQIRSLIADINQLNTSIHTADTQGLQRLENAYTEIAVQIRTHIRLEQLRTLLAEHKSLYQDAWVMLQSLNGIGGADTPETCEKQGKTTCRNDKNVAHKESTINKQSDKSDTCTKTKSDLMTAKTESETQCKATPICFPKQKGRKSQNIRASNHTNQLSEVHISSSMTAEDIILNTGIQHVTLKQALNASCETFRAHIPLAHRPMTWQDFVEAAYKLKQDLDINQNTWSNACTTLGRTGAAICVLLTDQARQRKTDPVKNSGAYFNAMIRRAHRGELNIHGAIFGILKRQLNELELS